MKGTLKTSIIAFSILSASLGHAVQGSGHTPAKSNGHRKATVLLKLKENPSTQEASDLAQMMSLYDLKLDKSLLNGKAGRYRIENSLYADRESEVLSDLKSTGALELADLDRKVMPSFVPNDSSYSFQWHHPKIGSEKAWQYAIGTKNVTVALCDAGFELNHPDISANFLLPGYNTVTNNSVITTHFHGTSTAGVIGAVGNNSAGVAGMAWKMNILPIQISTDPGGGSTISDVSECITYAADRGAKVVSVSYDYLYTSSMIDQSAQYLRSKGGILVIAAGNSAGDLSSYGSSPNMLVVGATDGNDQLAYFSNYGTPVDLVGPGLGIYTTYPGFSYATVDGTSFSTPMVAGTAALIYSLKPTFTPAEVDQFLLSTVVDLGPVGRDLLYAQGRLNAGSAVYKAALAADRTVPTVSFTAPTSGAIVSGSIQVRATATDNVGVKTVEFSLDGKIFASATTSPYSVTLNTIGFSNGLHKLTATARDFSGNASTATIDLNIRNTTLITLDNLPAGARDATRSFTGSWCQSSAAGSFGNSSLYSCGGASDTYRLTPSIGVHKSYRVKIRYTSNQNRGTAVPVVIKHSAGTTTKYLNMQVGGGTWVDLGTYWLTAGTANYLEVNDSKGQANIDGAQFEMIP